MKNKKFDLLEFLHEKIVYIIVIVAVASGLMASVKILNSQTTVEEEKQEQITYKTMSTVYESMSAVKTLNPLKSNDEDVYYISQLVYSSLFKLGNSLNVKKDLVSEYTTHPESGSVDLTLKKKAKFSDGTDVSAYDVSFTIREIKSIGSRSPYYNYVKKIDYVVETGSKSLTVYFKSSSDAALDNLVFPIVSESSYYSDSQNRILGSGQYMVSSYDGETTLKLKPNKHYFGTVAENKIQFKILPDKSTTPGLMTMDSITTYVSSEPDSDVDALDKDLLVTKIPSNDMVYLGFSFNNKYLKNKKFRKAIAYAIDNQAIINDNYGSMATESESIYYPGFLGTKKSGDAYSYDPKSAAQLLVDLGYSDNNEDGFLEDKKDKIITVDILVNSNDSARVDTANTISDYLEQVGIKANVEKKSWSDYKKAIRKGKFDIYIGGYSFDKQFDLRSLFAKNNPLGYKSDEVRSYVNKMETCIGSKTQKKTFRKLKSLINEDLPYYCICYKSLSFITVNHFESETVPTFFDVYRDAADWKWKRIVVTKDEKKNN